MKTTFKKALQHVKHNTAQAWIESLALLCFISICGLLLTQAQVINEFMKG